MLIILKLDLKKSVFNYCLHPVWVFLECEKDSFHSCIWHGHGCKKLKHEAGVGLLGHTELVGSWGTAPVLEAGQEITLMWGSMAACDSSGCWSPGDEAQAHSRGVTGDFLMQVTGWGGVASSAGTTFLMKTPCAATQPLLISECLLALLDIILTQPLGLFLLRSLHFLKSQLFFIFFFFNFHREKT